MEKATYKMPVVWQRKHFDEKPDATVQTPPRPNFCPEKFRFSRQRETQNNKMQLKIFRDSDSDYLKELLA